MTQREETITSLAEYISTHVDRLGGTLAIPARTLARLLIATNDGVTISGHIEGEDLYGPFLRMVLANVTPKSAPTAKSPNRR